MGTIGYNGNQQWGTIAGMGNIWGPKHKIPIADVEVTAGTKLIVGINGDVGVDHLKETLSQEDLMEDLVYYVLLYVGVHVGCVLLFGLVALVVPSFKYVSYACGVISIFVVAPSFPLTMSM